MPRQIAGPSPLWPGTPPQAWSSSRQALGCRCVCWVAVLRRPEPGRVALFQPTAGCRWSAVALGSQPSVSPFLRGHRGLRTQLRGQCMRLLVSEDPP